jgi:hypothetical protein
MSVPEDQTSTLRAEISSNSKGYANDRPADTSGSLGLIGEDAKSGKKGGAAATGNVDLRTAVRSVIHQQNYHVMNLGAADRRFFAVMRKFLE